MANVFYTRSEANKVKAEILKYEWELVDLLDDHSENIRRIRIIKGKMLNEEKQHRISYPQTRSVSVNDAIKLFFIRNLIDLSLMKPDKYPTINDYFKVTESWFSSFCFYLENKDKIDKFVNDNKLTRDHYHKWDYCRFVLK